MKKRTIYALGFFDGVHLGHQALLTACRELAESQSCKAGAVTFTTHPDGLVAGKTPALLNTTEDKLRLLQFYGMEKVLAQPFDKRLMTTPWAQFLQELDAAGFVCGHDFRFGNRGEGNADLLETYCKERHMPCAVVPAQMLDGMLISSTHIRKLLEEGKLEDSNRFLGHPHILSGTVVSGRKLGRTLGIPTANLQLPEGAVKLPNGVYACKATVDGNTYLAVTNIGNRPTVGGHRTTVEPWLLDFDGDLYGRQLTLSFYAFLRPEQKFPDLDALKEEIQKNASETRKFFENNAK